jgi:hypothetical protein
MRGWLMIQFRWCWPAVVPGPPAEVRLGVLAVRHCPADLAEELAENQKSLRRALDALRRLGARRADIQRVRTGKDL